VRRLRQTDRIDAEHRIERLDLDIEALHQPDSHAAELGQAAADAHLRQHVGTRGTRGEKPFDLVGQAPRNLLAGEGHSATVLIAP
jgi:hypothetical protein